MAAPQKPSRIQFLEKLDGAPTSGPPWKWIGVGALALLLTGGGILLVVVGGRQDRDATRKTAAPQTREAPDAGEAPITGSKARGVSGQPAARVQARARPGARPELAAPLRTSDGMLLLRGRVTAGTALITILTSAGASTRYALELLKALGKHFNLRRARPGHRFELHVDPKNRMPVYFRYQVSMSRIYEVRRAGDSFEARPVKVPVTHKLLRYAGTVGLSLGSELAARGAHPALLTRIADVLTSRPKFFRAQRFGDQFRVLVEEEQVGGHHLRFGPVLALEYRSVRSTQVLRLYYLRTGTAPGVYYTNKGISLPTARLYIPVHYTRMSSPFGIRFHPVLKRRILHAGVDFVAPAGTTVRATLPGKVIFAGRRGAYGNLVVIDHGGGLQSYYGHLLRFRRGLKRGEKVRARRAIGYVGSTGRSTGAHLHFGLKLAGRWIDPLSYRLRPGHPAPAGQRARLMRIIRQRKRLLATTPLWGPLRLPTRITSGHEPVSGVEEPPR